MVEIAAILGVVAMIAYCRFTTEAQRVFHLAAIWLAMLIGGSLFLLLH